MHPLINNIPYKNTMKILPQLIALLDYLRFCKRVVFTHRLFILSHLAGVFGSAHCDMQQTCKSDSQHRLAVSLIDLLPRFHEMGFAGYVEPEIYSKVRD